MSHPIKRPEERGWNRIHVDLIMGTLRDDEVKVMPIYGNVGAIDYRLSFIPQPDVVVTVFVSICEWQSEADVLFTNMTVLPEEERDKGHGSPFIKKLVEYFLSKNWTNIQATQVSNPQSIHFWERLGFKRLPDPNPTGDYKYVLP